LGGFERSITQPAGGRLLPPVQKLVATNIFAMGKNANQIPPSKTEQETKGAVKDRLVRSFILAWGDLNNP